MASSKFEYYYEYLLYLNIIETTEMNRMYADHLQCLSRDVTTLFLILQLNNYLDFEYVFY